MTLTLPASLCSPFFLSEACPASTLQDRPRSATHSSRSQGTQFLSSLLSFLRISSRGSAQQLPVECGSVKLDSGWWSLPALWIWGDGVDSGGNPSWHSMNNDKYFLTNHLPECPMKCLAGFASGTLSNP